MNECKLLAAGLANFLAKKESALAGRGLHLSTSQLNLSRFCL